MSKHIRITIFVLLHKRRVCETYVEPKQILVYIYKMYKDLIWTELFCDELSFPNSCCISSEMSKILFTQYFSPSRTNYKCVTPLSFHQNNNYSHIYWIITFKIRLTNQVAKQPGPFSLTIQPRKQKDLGTRLELAFQFTYSSMTMGLTTPTPSPPVVHR
jgi:hypothetical protein